MRSVQERAGEREFQTEERARAKAMGQDLSFTCLWNRKTINKEGVDEPGEMAQEAETRSITMCWTLQQDKKNTRNNVYLQKAEKKNNCNLQMF